MLPLHLSTQVDAQLVFLILEVQTVTQLSSEHIAELGRIIIVSYIKILAAQTVKPQTIIQTEQSCLVKSHTIRGRCPEIPVAATTYIITNVLYKSKILESWGRGIGTMVDECKRVGLPAPEFNTDGNFVWVVFKYNRNSVVVTPQLPHSYPTVTPQLMKVITVIRDNMMAAKEIMECIKLKDKTYFLDKYLYPAMEEGYVEQLYPENPKHPKQKYMLTEKGKVLLK